MGRTNIKIKNEKAYRCLKGIAHPVRLRILHELRKGPLTVGALTEKIATMSQSSVSQHLGQMRNCGILIDRREGNQVFYEAVDKKIFSFLDLIQELFCD